MAKPVGPSGPAPKPAVPGGASSSSAGETSRLQGRDVRPVSPESGGGLAGLAASVGRAFWSALLAPDSDEGSPRDDRSIGRGSPASESTTAGSGSPARGGSGSPGTPATRGSSDMSIRSVPSSASFGSTATRGVSGSPIEPTIIRSKPAKEAAARDLSLRDMPSAAPTMTMYGESLGRLFPAPLARISVGMDEEFDSVAPTGTMQTRADAISQVVTDWDRKFHISIEGRAMPAKTKKDKEVDPTGTRTLTAEDHAPFVTDWLMTKLSSVTDEGKKDRILNAIHQGLLAPIFSITAALMNRSFAVEGKMVKGGISEADAFSHALGVPLSEGDMASIRSGGDVPPRGVQTWAIDQDVGLSVSVDNLSGDTTVTGTFFFQIKDFPEYRFMGQINVSVATGQSEVVITRM